MKTISEHAIDIINGGEAALVLLIAATTDINFGGPMATGHESKICGIITVTLELIGDLEIKFQYLTGADGVVAYGMCFFQINDGVLEGAYEGGF